MKATRLAIIALALILAFAAAMPAFAGAKKDVEVAGVQELTAGPILVEKGVSIASVELPPSPSIRGGWGVDYFGSTWEPAAYFSGDMVFVPIGGRFRVSVDDSTAATLIVPQRHFYLNEGEPAELAYTQFAWTPVRLTALGVNVVRTCIAPVPGACFPFRMEVQVPLNLGYSLCRKEEEVSLELYMSYPSALRPHRFEYSVFGFPFAEWPGPINFSAAGSIVGLPQSISKREYEGYVEKFGEFGIVAITVLGPEDPKPTVFGVVLERFDALFPCDGGGKGSTHLPR